MYSGDYILSRDPAFLRWQFGPTPGSSADHHVIIALVDDRIRGCIGYIPIDLTVGGRQMRAAWAANWMVDQSVRRLGLGPLLVRDLVKRFEVTLALGGNSDAHDLLPRMGWTDFGMLHRYVAVIDPRAAARLTESNTLDWPVEPMPAGYGRPPAARVPRFHDDVTAFWDEGFGSTMAGTRRSAAYLNWRYADHPTFEYRMFELRCDGRIQGFGVSRIEAVRDSDVRVARILELVGDRDRPQALLSAMLDDARDSGAAVVDFFCSSARMDQVLADAGFLQSRMAPAAEIPILFQPIDRSRTGVLFMASLTKAPHELATAEWYVTKSDGDQDRPS
jgi:GNAT superfamily N-acetyltransferase